MSEVKHVPVWYPPQFPLQGRLPTRAAQVFQNQHRQNSQERDYRDALSLAAGRRVLPPCCKTVHISLFFDGTGNNLNNDLYLSNPKHPTNVARLFRASIGDGHAGGTAHGSSTAQGLTDAPGTGNSQFFKYYMPGVGTPFAEVGDLDYSVLGLAAASYGEERINWALLMILDALRRTLGQPRQDNASLLAAVRAMGSLPGLEWATGSGNRLREFYKQFSALTRPLRIALQQHQPGQVKLLGLKLYVYGFSRGAAAARAFVSALNQLLARATQSLRLLDLHLPVSVEYLGLLDTVASVGLADIIPGANGHMSWADGNQQLPANLVKRCLHLVASHEQRLCFPLESIRRTQGGYPANSVEVIYPGVHSDQGGGYPPGDQGKAFSVDSIEGDGLLLSQIALNDLYADAFAHGAPLKVPKTALSASMSHELWRVMDLEVVREFDTASELVSRFNAWRQVTLGLEPALPPLTLQQIEHYGPLLASESLEYALQAQLGWITAWRIDRYGFASLIDTDFYREASDKEADPQVRKDSENNRDAEQKKVEDRRKLQLNRERREDVAKTPFEPGVKDFDADMAQTQLREAAEEFAAAYRDTELLDNVAVRVLQLALPPFPFLAGELARAERQRIKAAGRTLVSRLFPPPSDWGNHRDEHTRGHVAEHLNATQPEGLLRALFDDQVHDSRAWFLYKMGREPGGHYFNERMVFFGDLGRRDLALYGEEGAVQLAAGKTVPTSESVRSTPPVMDAERLAEVHRAIDAIWDAYDANGGEVNDALV